MDAKLVLKAFSDHAKLDATYVPLKDKSTSRWHVNAKGREFELLLTGSKFFDTRAEKGGGGAVDLVMYLFALDFKAAADLLMRSGF